MEKVRYFVLFHICSSFFSSPFCFFFFCFILTTSLQVYPIDPKLIPRTRQWLLSRLAQDQTHFLRSATAIDAFGRAPGSITEYTTSHLSSLLLHPSSLLLFPSLLIFCSFILYSSHLSFPVLTSCGPSHQQR